jgi:hypothetical protein
MGLTALYIVVDSFLYRIIARQSHCWIEPLLDRVTAR